MKCQACGRKLRNPKSQEVGYGPICYERLFGSGGKDIKKESSLLKHAASGNDTPGQMSLEDYFITLHR